MSSQMARDLCLETLKAGRTPGDPPRRQGRRNTCTCRPLPRPDSRRCGRPAPQPPVHRVDATGEALAAKAAVLTRPPHTAPGRSSGRARTDDPGTCTQPRHVTLRATWHIEGARRRSLFVVKALSGISSRPVSCTQAGGCGRVVGWGWAREWLFRRAGFRGVSQPRWSQSRSPAALPGPLRPGPQ